MEFNKENILNKVKSAQQTTVAMDEGLRAYMLKVYNYMGYLLQSFLLKHLENIMEHYLLILQKRTQMIYLNS